MVLAQKVALPIARLALFVTYFWFGLLKVLGVSPVTPLVEALARQTLPFVSFSTFIIYFGALEMLIGVLFIWPRATRVALVLFGLHMITTLLPLICLPNVAWSQFGVPTLEGQYIIKNLALITCAVVVAASSRRSLAV